MISLSQHLYKIPLCRPRKIISIQTILKNIKDSLEIVLNKQTPTLLLFLIIIAVIIKLILDLIICMKNYKKMLKLLYKNKIQRTLMC